MKEPLRIRHVLAAFLIIYVSGLLPALRASLPLGSIAGAVVVSSSGAPVAQARVHMAGGDGFFSSAATGSDGSFSVEGLPAGSYEIAVESGEGLYPLDPPVQLTSGQHLKLDLALRAPNSLSKKRAASKSKGTGSPWSNPLTAMLIIAGSAVGLGILVESASADGSGAEASPFE